MEKRWFSCLRRVFSCKEKEKNKKVKKKKGGFRIPKEQGVFGHKGDSMPVHGVLGTPQPPPSTKKIIALGGNGKNQNDCSMVISTAVEPEAVAVAPCAAAEVVSLISSLRSPDGLSRKEIAATKVQNAFRVYLLGEYWNDSPQSKEQMEAKLQNRHMAALKRDKTLAYAYLHQWRSNSSRSKDPAHKDPSNPTARPQEGSQSVAGGDRLSNWSCILTSGRAPTCRFLSNQSLSTPPSIKRKPPRTGTMLSMAEDDLQSQLSFRSERHMRQHSIDGASMVRDDESVVSSPMVPGYLSSTVSSRAQPRFEELPCL